MSERDKPWSTKEPAEAAGVNSSYIRQLLLACQLDGYKVGRDWLIPADVGQKWLDDRRRHWEKF